MELSLPNANNNPIYMKDEDVPPMKWWKYVLIYSFVFVFIISIIIYTILLADKDLTFLLEKFLNILTIGFIYYLNGRFLVQKFKVKINYTRKINHFAIWVTPFLMDYLFDLEDSIIAAIWNIAFAFIGFVILTIPIRRNDCSGILHTVYLSLDRPEDRPNTLNWLTTQNILTGIVLTPFIILWNHWNKEDYKFIPLFIATFGDGFAEIIGVRFGKHKYKTTAWFTNKTYTRSYEGSSCVFITGIIMICIFYKQFTTLQLILNLTLIPLFTTITEAYSPHTMDNPFIILISGGILSLVHYV